MYLKFFSFLYLFYFSFAWKNVANEQLKTHQVDIWDTNFLNKFSQIFDVTEVLMSNLDSALKTMGNHYFFCYFLFKFLSLNCFIIKIRVKWSLKYIWNIKNKKIIKFYKINFKPVISSREFVNYKNVT